MDHQQCQVDMMTALGVMFYTRKLHNDFPPPRSSDYDDEVMTMLNWIATCFVKHPQGDVVTTALASQEGQITIFIANSIGTPDSTDFTNFRMLINNMLAESDDNKNVTAVSRLVSVMAQHRFARKLDMLLQLQWKYATRDGVEIIPRFNSIVDEWASRDGNRETSTALLHMSYTIFNQRFSNNECLKRLFSYFISQIASRQTNGKTLLRGEEVYKKYKLFAGLAYFLVAGNFFRRIVDDDVSFSLTVWDRAWILKLRRRLWRIARYAHDTDTFVKRGIPFIRKVLGATGLQALLQGDDTRIQLIWVQGDPAIHTRSYQMPDSVIYMQDLLSRLEYKEPTSQQSEQFVDLWNRHVTPRLHCEIQMIRYLTRYGIVVYKNFIGNSKLMCWSCHAYVEEINKTRPSTPWVLSGTSGKPHYAWLLPMDGAGHKVYTLAQQELVNAGKELVEFLRGDSDSSSGSCGLGTDMDIQHTGTRFIFGDGGNPL